MFGDFLRVLQINRQPDKKSFTSLQEASCPRVDHRRQCPGKKEKKEKAEHMKHDSYIDTRRQQLNKKITISTSPVRWATHLFSASSSASVCKIIVTKKEDEDTSRVANACWPWLRKTLCKNELFSSGVKLHHDVFPHFSRHSSSNHTL